MVSLVLLKLAHWVSKYGMSTRCNEVQSKLRFAVSSPWDVVNSVPKRTRFIECYFLESFTREAFFEDHLRFCVGFDEVDYNCIFAIGGELKRDLFLGRRRLDFQEVVLVVIDIRLAYNLKAGRGSRCMLIIRPEGKGRFRFRKG